MGAGTAGCVWQVTPGSTGIECLTGVGHPAAALSRPHSTGSANGKNVGLAYTSGPGISDPLSHVSLLEPGTRTPASVSPVLLDGQQHRGAAL